MKIVASQKDLDLIVRRADGFTDKNIGSPQHMQQVLIEVDEEAGTVTVTAENVGSAIRFVPTESIDILEGGRVLVNSSWLRTTLSVIPEDQRVTVETENKGKTLHVTGGKAEVTLALVDISSDKVLLPTVGEADRERSITVDSEEFISGFQTGSAAHDAIGRYPVLKSVHVALNKGKLRFTSLDKLCTTFCSVPVHEGADELEFLLEPDITRSTLEYIRQGKRVKIHPAESGSFVHYRVLDAEGGLLYHIRAACLAYEVSQYPAAKLEESICNRLSPSMPILVMDKMEVLRLFHSAEKIATLNKSGQAKEVSVTLSKDGMTVEIAGSVSFEDEAEVKSWSSNELGFVFKWGLFGSLIEAYPGKDEFRAAVLEKGDGTPYALAMFSEEGWDPAEKQVPQSYFTMVPLSNGSYRR